MLPEFVDDLVHLEGGSDGLDEASSTNGSTRNLEQVLRHAEDVVPKPGFQVVLHLGKAVERRNGVQLEKLSVLLARKKGIRTRSKVQIHGRAAQRRCGRSRVQSRTLNQTWAVHR